MSVIQEREFKFEGLSNYQFKFVPLCDSETIINTLQVVCELLDIRLGKACHLKIVDEYFDDKNWALRSNGLSFRRRVIDDKSYVVTLKAREDPSTYEGLHQRSEYEFECTTEAFDGFISESKNVTQRFREKLGIEIDCSELKRIITVHNDRTQIPITIQNAGYAFCYDKFYYYTDHNGRYSEFFTEIEIESEGKYDPADTKLRKLINAVRKLISCKPTKKPKIERGLDWASTGNKDIGTVYTIMFDIVGFTKRTPDVQQQMIQSS